MKRKAVLYRGDTWSRATLPSFHRPLTRAEERVLLEQVPDEFVPRLDSCDPDDPPGVLAKDAPARPLPSKVWKK